MADNQGIRVSDLPKKDTLDAYDDLLITSSLDGSSNRSSAVNFARQVGATPITVDTYADAVPYFTGNLFRRIDVISDSDYNLDEDPESPTFGQGMPSFYTYNPLLPTGKKVAFLGLDFDYLTNV